MNEMVKEKMPYTKGKSVALTVISVILTCLLCTVLLGCYTAHRFVYEEPVGKAFSKIKLDEMTLSDGTTLVTKLNRDYIGEGVISDDKLTKVLQNGTFKDWVGQKAEGYTSFVASPERSSREFPEIMTPEIEALLVKNDSTIRLYTGTHDFAENNPQILRNMKPDLENWNKKMRESLCCGFSAKLLFAAVSEWIWYVLGGLLLLLLVWMIIISVKSHDRVGTGIKRFAVTCVVPGALVLFGGLLAPVIASLSGHAYLKETVTMLHSAPIAAGGLCCLASCALFAFGMLWNAAASALQGLSHREKQPRTRVMPVPAPTPAPAVALTKPAAPITNVPEIPQPETSASTTRKFCRFCGGELVNSDAKFCYKCGKAQE